MCLPCRYGAPAGPSRSRSSASRLGVASEPEARCHSTSLKTSGRCTSDPAGQGDGADERCLHGAGNRRSAASSGGEGGLPTLCSRLRNNEVFAVDMRDAFQFHLQAFGYGARENLLAASLLAPPGMRHTEI